MFYRPKGLKIHIQSLKKELSIVRKQCKNSGGFTLAETLVAITVFITVLGAASGLFINAIQNQRRALATQELLSQTSYLIEYMTRYIRMAKKDLTGNCLTTAGAKSNYQTNPSKNMIRFLNYQDKCQEFFLDTDQQIKERKSTDSSAANFGASLLLTSPRLQVVSFRIESFGWSQEDTNQPRVTIFLNIRSSGPQPHPPEIRIQTTISQRQLDVKY